MNNDLEKGEKKLLDPEDETNPYLYDDDDEMTEEEKAYWKADEEED